MQTDLPGRERLLRAFQHETVSPVPWVPFAGVHAGQFTDTNAAELLSDLDKLVPALLAAQEAYQPDGMPVLFDLQIEAEILGCDLLWSEKAPPSVASHPLADSMRVPTHLPTVDEGRLPLALAATRALKEKLGDQTALFGLITGPLTLASHLRGTELFMDMFDHRDFTIELLTYCREVALRMAEHYLAAGADVIAVVDPLVSQVSPRHFKRFLSEPYQHIFQTFREQNIPSAFFVCGDATKNIEVMCQTGPDAIFVDENIDMVPAKAITDRYNIVLGGNVPLTTTMLFGTQQDNMQYVVDWLDKLQPPNLVLAPGCDMPYEVPPENTIGLVQALQDPEKAKAMLATYEGGNNLPDVELPDYTSLPRPLIEVFTLDSSTCAACTYMLGAAQRASDSLAGKVDLVEYKITQPESVSRAMKLGIQSFPSICINGEVRFASIIPSNRELMAALDPLLT